jgi:hypothetical protein
VHLGENEIPDLVRTLTAAAFELVTVERKANFLLFHLVRPDEFGIAIRYLLAYSGKERMSSGDMGVLEKIAANEGASLVFVSDSQVSDGKHVLLTSDELFGRLGGVVDSMLPLESEYPEHLELLGFNRLPTGLRGKPDELFEAYAHAGLQFLWRGRVIRYGQERRFEAVPDGLALGARIPLLLYDCKAANISYEFSATTIRQFADYINDFHRRYLSYLGRLHCFLAISSAFQDEKTLRNRSDELYGKCGVPLVCLTAKDLAQMVSLFSQHLALRSVVDWADILRSPAVDFNGVKAGLEARIRDRIIRE